MDASGLFPSRYLNAADVAAAPLHLSIAGLTVETMPDGTQKPVLSFNNQAKQLVLNKTNTAMLITLFGKETDHWYGQVVECYPDKVTMQGRIVDCIRIRQPVMPAQPPAVPPAGP